MIAIVEGLSAIQQGNPQAAEQLLPLVYDELRRLAAQKIARESPGQTLDATALVHEVYLRLVATGTLNCGTAEGTFSPPLPRPCGGFWSSGPGINAASRRVVIAVAKS